MESRDLLALTPSIPDFVYERLPEFFKGTLEPFLSNRRERDVTLIGMLSAVSGCLENISGRYGNDRFKPPIFGFVVAPAASGKSTAKNARLIGLPMQRRLMAENDENIRKYKTELKKWEMAGGKNRQSLPPDKPVGKYLFLPGDTSAASLYERLYQNGGRGIIFETEADAFTGSLKQDWGSFSDGLRKGFQHEPISVSRKTNDTYYIIERPSIAIFLTGTPLQFKNLIRSSENGLFSRFIWYGYTQDLSWNNPQPCDECTDHKTLFEHAGEEILGISDWLDKYPVDFRLSSDQFQRLNAHFAGKLEEIRDTDHEGEASSIFRLGLICFRIAMILSVFRQIEVGVRKGQIDCDDLDFEIALTLVDTFHDHARVMLTLLGEGSMDQADFTKIDEFLSLLPQEFTKIQANEIGRGKIGISLRTVTNYLGRLINAGKLKKVSYGIYRKIE